MNTILAFFTPARRKALYTVTAAVNAFAIAVVPVLQSFGWFDSNVAAGVLQVSGAVLALVSAIVAIPNVPKSEDSSGQ